MSTTMPKAQNITRKWYVIDAADKPLGRTAAKERCNGVNKTICLSGNNFFK